MLDFCTPLVISRQEKLIWPHNCNSSSGQSLDREPIHYFVCILFRWIILSDFGPSAGLNEKCVLLDSSRVNLHIYIYIIFHDLLNKI